MNSNLVISLLIALILLTICACSPDDEASIDTIPFAFERHVPRSDGLTYLLFLTNQDGTVLFDTIAPELDFIGSLDNVSPNDEIDYHVGTIFTFNSGSSLNLRTFRNIKSGFNYSLDPSQICDTRADEFLIGEIFNKRYELTIEGIDEYNEIHMPTKSSTLVTTQAADNQITLVGNLDNNHDLLLSISPQQSEELMGYVLEFEDWIPIVETINGQSEIVSVKRTIDFEDFETIQIHQGTIDPSIFVSTQVTASMKTTEGVVIELAHDYIPPNNYLEFPILPEMNIEKLKLKTHLSGVFAAQIMDIHSHKVYETLPNQIVLTPPQYNDVFINNENLGFSYSLDRDFDVAITKLNIDPTTIWRIYQRSDLSLSYQLPTIPPSIQSQLINLGLQTTSITKLSTELYEYDSNQYDSFFDKTSIDRFQDCLEYDFYLLRNN